LHRYPENICLNTFDFEYYKSLSDGDRLGFELCLRSGVDNPDSGMGCYACQPEDYDRFKPFFSKALAKVSTHWYSQYSLRLMHCTRDTALLNRQQRISKMQMPDPVWFCSLFSSVPPRRGGRRARQ
jgi:hypothetical protein